MHKLALWNNELSIITCVFYFYQLFINFFHVISVRFSNKPKVLTEPQSFPLPGAALFMVFAFNFFQSTLFYCNVPFDANAALLFLLNASL